VNHVLASAETRALGTTVRVVTHDGDPDRALRIVATELEHIEQACSRFRADSDLTLLNESPGRAVTVDPRLVRAVGVAIRAARLTDGRVDPTIGNALCLLGYDADFAAIAEGRPARTVRARRVPGWRGIVVDRVRSTVRLPAGVRIDLGATAKADAADQVARLVHETLGGGVLVSLGGDIAVAGPAPDGGWPVRITDDHTAGVDAPGETVSIRSGGLATSSTTVRRWTQGNEERHHLLDPATGLPADGPFRTVSVAAGTCVDANIASTASIVLGSDAPAWLAQRRLPARLTRHDGSVMSVGAWPTGPAWTR
jgi:thiamine biosynthesis lipoprotein ApbE